MNKFFENNIRFQRQKCRCILLLFGMAMICTTKSFSQDVEEVFNQKILQVNGGVTANTTFYHANGIDNRRDPFYWLLSANLNFNILGIIQAPFSMTISQQNKNFSQPQPFNRFGLSPRYKSVTAHLGHRSMNFSEYSLSGNLFLGAGVEVMPESSFIRVSAMYGRFSKPVEKSAQKGLVFANPTFRRLGYGMKVGLGRDKHLVDLIFFKASDDENSITITDEVLVNPEENLVLALRGQHEVTDRIAFEFEYAYSLFTRDKRAAETGEKAFSFANNLGGLFRPNISSEFNKAITSAVNYQGNGYQANIKFRRVDPGYRTLGSSFLNNGIVDVAGGLSWNMLSQKMNIATNFGIQQSIKKQNSVRRAIYGINVNYNVSDRLSLNSSYANFATTTRQAQLQRDILVDSLEYFQVTRSGSMNANLKLGGESNAKTLFLSASIQDAFDSGNNASTFFNLNIGEQMKIANEWQLSVSASFNRNKSELFENISTGPVLGINRSFLEGKIRTALSSAFLQSYLEGKLQSEVINISWTNGFKVAKKHSVSVSTYYLHNNLKAEEANVYGEFRGIINYNYSF